MRFLLSASARYSFSTSNGSESDDIHTFTVGATYFGNLFCEHSEHNVVCVKHTAKTVWLAEVTNPFITQDGKMHTVENWKLPRRSTIHWSDDWRGPMEYANI